MKFTHKYLILERTHEKIWCAQKMLACVASTNSRDMLLDMQIGRALAMIYFGGYVSKKQKVGQRETERLSMTFNRKTEGKDMESKGMIRTAVEATFLSLLLTIRIR